ncbi:efflux transporter outer membrane subunit [Geomesophilobacter sediminis]|uniref:Efflux transporter outer membrane subunit n=1 Tax=Geomesophilobacter sediminis TaxID=2798584 RepID=A0A8J7LW62_9BACT|nr:efflux transporter outer membrane subunit [Geomesophilobacter sediminis]MBJ6725455.1 efflux transporter outer membrane subunit [Geomesophilobacter sediminis]
MYSEIRSIMLIAAAVLLSACAAVGPNYRAPELKVPTEWQAPQAGKSADVNAWWSRFQDPALSTLLEAAQQENPTLLKAAAAIEKARASRSAAESGFLPSVTASAGTSWSGSLKNGTGTGVTTGATTGTSRSSTAGLDASWEVDLFGKSRRTVESAGALLQAREADWHDARVSLGAEVATTYVDYRGGRLKQKYYEEQADSQAKTAELTALAAKAGFTAPADARLAEASAASTRSTALAQQGECELLVKSLVALTGLPEASVRQTLGADIRALPVPDGLKVTALPADLLRQRPDIVSAERTLASTSALIGAAEAEKYPSFSLSGSVGLSAATGTSLLAPWSFGPTVSLPLFDGGKIAADIKGARADYAAARAGYQQVVRDAVKEVEQALVRLDSVARQEEEAKKSAAGYRAYVSATEANWRVGRASLLDLETARRSAIGAEVTLLDLQQSRLEYWIALYKAVGGGWKSTSGEATRMAQTVSPAPAGKEGELK